MNRKGDSSMIRKEDLMNTLLKLVEVPGISGTESEELTAKRVYELTAEIPYFSEHKENLRMIRLEQDPYNRSFVSALLRMDPGSRKTVILTGHHDVVDVEEYGHLKPYAFNPAELAGRIQELKLDEDSAADLRSGDWIFGRGTADMKFGLALCIELLREYSRRNDFKGNLLFLSVPSEETNSEGMLGAAEYLSGLQENEGYEFTAVMLTECYAPKNAGDKMRYIHYGASGKIMPMFFFAGKETHVSEPFAGIDPTLMSSEVNKLLNLNTGLCEYSKGVATPPPICLRQVDLKTLYSVQTALYAAAYYNVVTLGNDTERLLSELKKLALQAFSNVLKELEARHRSYEEKYGQTVDRFEASPYVITYKELYDRVKEHYGLEFDSYLDSKIEEWDRCGLDIQTKAVYILKETMDRYPEKRPMIVISFIPPYYPSRFPEESTAKNRHVLDAIEDIMEYAASKHNEPFEKAYYYTGICDLSYTGLEENCPIDEVYENMPGAGRFYKLPVESLKVLDIPGFVLGPYGKDVHKYTERLNISFSFDVIPDLYEYAINRLFA
ncbi:MAG TPA: M20/M25/M40 family metallo-hydrolase [Clostridia bacterium]|nr:M20/M25/M40 family metallo-hydrolase [Clostridia bacterium]